MAGSRTHFGGDERLTVHGSFKQGYTESFRPKIRWEYDAPTQSEQRHLYRVVYVAGERYVVQPEHRGLFLQLTFRGPGAGDDNFVRRILDRIEQDV